MRTIYTTNSAYPRGLPTYHFATRQEANTWLTGVDTPIIVPALFVIGSRKETYIVSLGATMIPDLPNSLPSGLPMLGHWGVVDSLTVNNGPALLAAMNSGSPVACGYPGETYFFDQPLKVQNTNGFTLDLNGATLKAGPNANPGLYFLDGKSVRVIKGTYDGNKATSPWLDLMTMPGIAASDRTGTAAANYSGVSTITVENLAAGDSGTIKAGDRVVYIIDGVNYVYRAISDTTVTGGVATIQLNKPVSPAITLGQNIFIEQASRMMTTKVAYPAGTSQIILCAASLKAGSGNVLKAGDQFSFYDNDNDLATILTSEIYTITEDATLTGVAPNLEVVAKFTPALATSKHIGQRVTSFVDQRNNTASSILFVGCTDCHVEDMTIKNAKLHGVAFNATINAPFDGFFAKNKPNFNCSVKNCTDKLGGPGAAFVGAYCVSTHIKDSVSSAAPIRNGSAFEKSIACSISGCDFDDMKYGASINGDCDGVNITKNTIRNCAVGVIQRNVCKDVNITENVVELDALSQNGIVVLSGYDGGDEEEPSTILVTFNNFTLVAENHVTGPGQYTGETGKTHFGVGILVCPIGVREQTALGRRPHYVRVVNNFLEGQERHGIYMFQAAYGSVSGNTVVDSGEDGIKGFKTEQTIISDNTVSGAGRRSLVPVSAAYLLDNCIDATFRGNSSAKMDSPGLDFGIKAPGTSFLRYDPAGLKGSTDTITTAYDAGSAPPLTSVRMALSSTTNITINTAAKTFAFPEGDVGLVVGQTVRAHVDDTRWIQGKVTAVTRTSITILPEIVVGSGSYASWLIFVPNGLVPKTFLDSTTSRSLGTGSKIFTVSNLEFGTIFTVGSRVRAYNDASHYMDGLITAIDATTITVTADRVVGSGTYAAWTIFLVGGSSPSEAETLQNKTLDNTNFVTLKDTQFTLQDDSDPTKQLRLQLAGITAGNTRTLTPPDADTVLYGRSNLVGTVSQASGAVTGDAFERNSNGQGRWQKDAAGGMRCSRDELLVTAITTADGSDYRSGDVTWTFPQPFASVPLPGFVVSDSQCDVKVVSVTKTAVTFRVYSKVAKNFAHVSCEALGRWFASGIVHPSELFLSGEKGAWWNFRDPATLFTDTARTTLITANGAVIAGVTDLSGNGMHLQQSDSAKRPVFNIDAAGRGGITFDGINDCLTTVSSMALGMGQVTILAAVRKLADVSARLMELGPTTAATPNTFGVVAPNTNVGNFAMQSVGANGTVMTASTPTSYAAPISAVIVGLGDTAASKVGIRANKGAEISVATAQGGGNYASQTLNLGARNNGAVTPYNGLITEVIIRAGILSEADITSLTERLYANAGV